MNQQSRSRALLLVALMMGSASTSQAAQLPVAIAAKILFKIATYDGNLPAKTVRVAVLYHRGDEAGPDAVKVLSALGDLRVNGRTLETIGLPYSDAASLEPDLKGKGLYALFVPATTPVQDIAGIRHAATAHKLLTFAQDAAMVEGGLTVGVRQGDQRREILLNLPVALEQQRRFDGAFLAACTVLR